MPDQRITDLTALLGANVADGDLIPIVDVSDTTMAASGTNKKITRSELINALALAFQPLDSDLTAIAALSTTSFGRALLTLADAAALRSTAGVVIGTDVQAYDSDLAAIAALSTTTFGRSFLTLADAGAAQTLVGTYSTSQIDSLVNATAANVGKRARVRAATTANITIASDLNNGDVIDGVTLATGDLVLVKNQSSAAENGVYVVGTSPARFVEFDTYDEHPGSLIAAQEGTTNADTLWLCTSNTGGTLGTTAIAFTKLVVAGELLAANNLSDLANATTARTNLGVAIGTNVQAWDADLDALAGVTSAADRVPYFTGSATASVATFTALGRAIVGASTLTANGVLYGNGSSAIGATAAGTAGEALISAGSGSAPAYGTVCDVKYYTATPDAPGWSKPANAKAVYVLLMGGGGSGGAGEKIAAAAGTNSGGGGGGAGGGISWAWYDAAALSATETVTVGTGGTAPGTTTTVGAGANGNAGNATTFTVGGTVALYAGGGGGGGGGGQAGAGAAGAVGDPTTAAMWPGGGGGVGASGALSSNATAGTAGQYPGVPGGGGGGGGSTTTTGRTAAAGGASSAGTGTTGTGIAGGTAGAGAGGNAAAVTALGNVGHGNAGGGGGGQRTTAGNGGTGAAGGTPGGGGGGGGNGIGATGTNSNGNGGAGGRGFALVITFR
jgi:hypothetical protein